MSLWVQPSNGRPTTSVVRPCVFIRFVLCPVSAVWNHPSRKNLCQKPSWRQGAGGTVGLLWQTRTRRQPSALSVRRAVSDTNSASTLRSFRSEGCVACFGGVKSLTSGAARRAGLWFLFSSSFPLFFVTPPAGVNIDAAPPADTGGYEYGPGGGIGGARGLADRSLYSSNFSVCGISISFFPGCSGCYFVRGEVYVYCFR